MISQNVVKVGYYDPFSVWPQIKESVLSKLPLNLYVRLDSNQSLKTISQLGIQFEEEVPKKGDYYSLKDDRINSNVYVRLMFVAIDDIERYRGQVRPLIREWLKNLIFKAHDCTWMIVLYISPDSRSRHNSLIKTSFFDKLKVDFGPQGKQLNTILPGSEDILTKYTNERCFKFKHHHSEVDILEEFVSQLKTLLISSFSHRFTKFNDVVRNEQSSTLQRLLAKLEMCFLFQDMKLLTDALIINEQITEELKIMRINHHPSPAVFDYSIVKPTSLDNKFQFEHLIHKKITEEQLISGEDVNVFQLRCLLFGSESAILIALAKEAMSKSLITSASKEISRLYQRLMRFLSDFESGYNCDYELEFVIIGYFLNLDIVKELITLMEKSSVEKEKVDGNEIDENEENVVHLTEFMEMRAELKLFMRSVVIKIAQNHNIQVEGLDRIIMEEISLEETPTTTTATPTTKINKPLTNQELIQIVKTKSSYLAYFESLTEEIIKDFVSCGRARTIDILSLDLAVVNYEKGNYKQCLTTLSYEYFASHGWNLIGGVLLDVYLKCIEKLESENKKEILHASVNLLSMTNTLPMLQDKRRIEQLFKKIGEVDDDYVVEFPLVIFFTKTLVKPFVYADESSSTDIYYIEIHLENPFGVEIDVAQIELVLIDERGCKVIFSKSEIKLSASKGVQSFKLNTRNIIFGVFSCHKLLVRIGKNLLLEQNFGPNHGNKSILICQDEHKFRARFIRAQNRSLLENNPSLKLTNGNNQVNDLKIELFSDNSDIKLANSVIDIKTLSPSEIREIQIALTVPVGMKLASLHATGHYSIDGEKYSFQIFDSIDISLSISVSVQDVFKPNFLYSRFQVNTVSSQVPIRLISHSLENEDYEIKGGLQMGDVLAFGEQPISLVYRMTPKEKENIVHGGGKPLKLSIKYRSTKDEVEKILLSMIMRDLVECDLAKYYYLCECYILPKMKFDLNRYANTGIIEILNVDHLLLNTEKFIFQYVEADKDQNKLLNIFKRYTVPVMKIDKPGNSDQEDFDRLYIDVPVPLLQFLHSVEFHYSKQIMVVGEPVPMTITAATTTKWAGPKQPQQQSESLNKEAISLVKFKLEIAQGNDFLIDGTTTHVFEVPKNESSFSMDIILIPLAVGKWKLPKISVKQLNRDKTDVESFSEVYLVNSGELVTVVPHTNEIAFTF
ncbi:TRS130 [Candida oxycetoniae]|uniref:TRS130 n=1 Tax=Candida oxycetoniae TaxID=497107 RepID=A0AAI9X010_9ASCO|nr:TRS130 [Candida oxycetoniae]KAI3406624.2 TRS130 [Candida oxycetoniae]